MIPLIGILGLVAASRTGAKSASGGGGQNPSSKRTERGGAAIKEQDPSMTVLAHAAPGTPTP